MKLIKGKISKTTLVLLLLFSLLSNFSISVKAETINNTTEEPPIILIPGIMGSNLYADEEFKTRIWGPEVNLNPFSSTSIYNLGKNIEISKPLYAKPGINEVPLPTNKREYGLLNVYKKLMDKLCEEFPNRQIYFFSYDFRQGNEQSAEKLKDYIDNTIKADSVDIISHSMGGNVVVNYAKKDKSKIHKFISLGAPLEGAPKIIKCALDNAVVDTKWNLADYILSLCGLSRNVKAGYSSIAELFPSEKYFNSTVFKSKFENGNSQEVRDIDYATYYRYCKAIFGNKYDDAIRVQKSIDTDNVNLLRNFSNAYFAVGVNQKTISSIVFKDGNTLDDIGVDSLIYDNNGDSTVPLSSLTLMGNLENSAAHIRYFEGVNHGTLVTKDESINWIIDTLKNKESNEGLASTPEAESYVVMRMEAPVDVNIEKDNETLTSKNSLSTEASYGRVDTIGKYGQVKMIAIDDDSNYNIEFDAKDKGKINFTIEWYDSHNNLQKKKEINNVEISSETKIYPSSIDINEDTSLLVDEDNDGVVDSKISCN